MRSKLFSLALALLLATPAAAQEGSALRLDFAAKRLDGMTGAGGFPLFSTSALTSGRVPLVTTGGALKDDAGITWSGTTTTAQVNAQSGFGFVGAETSGVFKNVANVPVFKASGNEVVGFYIGAIQFPSVNSIQWSSGAINAASDLGLVRASAGLLKVTSGGSNLGSLQAGNLTATALATPGSITVAPQGTGGAVTWTYVLVARLGDGTTTQAGAASSTAVGNATLTATDFNRLSWSAVTNAADYVVYRTVAGTTPATTGIIYTGTALTVDDKALAGGGQTAPTRNVTGRVVAVKANISGLSIFANNAAAVAGGLVAGDLYRTNADPDPVMVVH